MLLHVDRIEAGYPGHSVLRDVSFYVDEAEIVCFLGRNGAGKTTLLQTIRGADGIIAGSGNILMQGKSLLGLRTDQISRIGIGYCPADRGCFESLTVAENLRISQRGVREPTLNKLIDLAFPLLHQRKSQKAGSLSGGERQILVLAMSVASRPKIALIDELSQGLQPSNVEASVLLMRELVEAFDMSILYVEQSVGSTRHLGGRTYLLERGEIAMSLTADEVSQQRELLERKLFL